jgi:hypothetical protein
VNFDPGLYHGFEGFCSSNQVQFIRHLIQDCGKTRTPGVDFTNIFLRAFFHPNVFFSSYVLLCARKTRAKMLVKSTPGVPTHSTVALLETKNISISCLQNKMQISFIMYFKLLGSISSAFYKQLLHAQIPSVQKNSQVVSLSGSARAKAACITLIKLPPGLYMLLKYFVYIPYSSFSATYFGIVKKVQAL